MPAADWETVKRLVDEALSLETTRRAELLERECAGREELRAEVLSLVLAHERAGAFLETGPRAVGLLAAADEALLGTSIGPYRILSVLGRGGMGIVYRALRDKPAREAALKLLRPGGDAQALPARFQAEQQILARFDHPYIARLFDAGTTPDGRPWFVMELAAGRAIDRHCGDRRLDLRARLLLFLKVCQAVAYAHARLVVHRDIKPSNVLVSDAGEPKLLDFGIARLLDDGTERQATQTGLRLMTPQYASPEQVRGEPASVATDVHALGLLLYLLLTGRGPFRLRSPSAADLVRVICVDEVRAPSAALDAATAPTKEAGFEPVEPSARLARLLRGDLDAVVARALRKEPERRYPSVEQLADDVRRFLDGRTVLAREGRLRYRAGKFVRRNPVSVALAASLLLALGAGLAATAWQARVARAERARAERRFADVRRLATRFLFDFHDAIRDLPGSTKAREMVVHTALDYLDQLAREAGDDRQLQIELAQAYYRVGLVQGVPGSGHLGDSEGALRSLSAAQAILAQAGSRARGDAAYRTLRLDVAVVLARVNGQIGAYDRALDLLREAELEARAFVPELSDLESTGAVSRVYYELALELDRRRSLAEAERATRESLRLAHQIAARWPEDPLLTRRLAPTHRNLAEIQMRLGRYPEARVNARAAVDLRRAAYSPGNGASARGLMAALLVQAEVERDGDDAHAQSAYAEALGLAERLAAGDPDDSQAFEDAGGVAGAWCAQLNRASVRRRKRDVCGEALRVFEQRSAREDVTTRFNLADMRLHSGRWRELQGDPRGALRLYERALAAASSPLLAGGGAETAQQMAQIQLASARARLALRQPSEAREAARTAIRLLSPVARDAEDVYLLETYVEAHSLAARAELALSSAHSDGAACTVLEPAAETARRLRTMTIGLPRPLPGLTEYEAQRAPCGAATPAPVSTQAP